MMADAAAVDHECRELPSFRRAPVGIVAVVSMNTIWNRNRANAAVS
jgi:hypothetical protein